MKIVNIGIKKQLVINIEDNNDTDETELFLDSESKNDDYSIDSPLNHTTVLKQHARIYNPLQSPSILKLKKMDSDKRESIKQ